MKKHILSALFILLFCQANNSFCMKRIVEQTADTQTTSLKKIEGEGPDQKRKVKRKQKGKEYSECCKDATALAGISLMLVKAIFLFYYICSKLS